MHIIIYPFVSLHTKVIMCLVINNVAMMIMDEYTYTIRKTTKAEL